MAKRPRIPFAEIKDQLSFETVLRDLYSIELKKNRGTCPKCGKERDFWADGRGEKAGFKCHSSSCGISGKDVIALVKEVEDLPGMYEAAQYLMARYKIGSGEETPAPKPDPTPAREPPQEPVQRGMRAPLQHLEHDHELVLENGLSAHDAEQIGIGYARRGANGLAGNLAIPIRLQDGTLVGYAGVKEITWLPKEWKF